MMDLLEVSGLFCSYAGSNGRGMGPPVLHDVSFRVKQGTCVGLVGESGSGKTTLGRVILKLIGATEGRVLFDGKDILPLSEKEFRPLRKDIQMVFQDPYGSLNPRMTVADILAEPLEIHGLSSGKEDKLSRMRAALDRVGLPGTSLTRYPHEFSGGQRQRIGIARALAVEPRLLVLDEPVSALDVSVQAQIINLLQDLQESLGLTYLLIAHDLAVVRHISREILVLREGRIVESGPAETVCGNPSHDYTKALLDAVPTF